MVLEHAPVTGLLLCISTLSTTITPRHYMALQRQYVIPGWKATIKRLPLETLPFGSLGVSLTDVFCSVILLFQMRLLERRWGSSPFLAFILTATLAGSILLNILVSETTPPLSLEQLRILSAGGSIVPLVALATRLLAEVPSLHHWRIPITSVVLTENLSIILPLVRLILFPDTEIRARTHKQRAVHVDLGLWTRLLLALFGIIIGMASKKKNLLSWWIGFTSRYICRPFINFMQPLFSALFGPTNTVELGIPRQNNNGQSPTGGRYTVDNLAGFQDNENQQLRRAYSFGDPSSRETLRRRGDPFTERNNNSIFNGSILATDERVMQIMELGLGFDPETIRSALTAANGHVDVAVEYLVNRQ